MCVVEYVCVAAESEDTHTYTHTHTWCTRTHAHMLIGHVGSQSVHIHLHREIESVNTTGAATAGSLMGQSPTAGALAAGLAGAGYTSDTIQGVLRRRAAQQAANAIASGQTQGPPPNLAYRGLFTTGLVPPEPNQ